MLHYDIIHCIGANEVMPTNHECVFCCEIDTVSNKFQESENDISCITDHEGFESVRLVLQTAYFKYRQWYGEAVEKTACPRVSEIVCHYLYPLLLTFLPFHIQEVSVYCIPAAN